MNLQPYLHHEDLRTRDGLFALSQSGANLPSGLTQALSSLIEHIVEEQLAVRLAQPVPAPQPSTEWLTVKDAMQLFQVCRQTIHRWAKKGLISRYKIDERGMTYFSKAELAAAFRQQLRPDGTRKHARRSYQQRPASR